MKKIILTIVLSLLTASFAYCQDRTPEAIHRHLSLAHEHQLQDLNTVYSEGYRFIIADGGWRSSDIVTVYRKNDKYFIAYKEVDSYYVGKDDSKILKAGRTKVISKEDWDSIIVLVNQSAFWTMPRREEKIGFIGLDGSFWIIQGVKNNLTHEVMRWSPDKGKYRKLCLAIWRLSGSFMGMYKDKVE